MIRLIFSNPKKSDVLVYDEANSDYLKKYVLENIDHEIFHIKKMYIYVSFQILFRFFISYISVDLKKILSTSKNLRFLIKESIYYYNKVVIEYINPKVILTFVDNSSSYHWLCKNYGSAKFIAIQNGNRTSEQLDVDNKQYHREFVCFGEYEIQRYAKYGHYIQKPYPLGSFLGGIYKSSNLSKKKNNINDIAIISQIKDEMISNNFIPISDYHYSLFKMHEFCNKYIHNRNLKAEILLRNIQDFKKEIDFYRNFYKDRVNYIEKEREMFSSYQGMDNSRLIISFFSTSTIEAFAWGKKILHCDFSKTVKFNDYDEMIMFRENNYESFEKRLDELMKEDDGHYIKRTKKYSSFLINNNKTTPPHKFVRKLILNYLNN